MGKALTDLIEPLNILWYGDAGTGKTTDLANMANVGVVEDGPPSPLIAMNAESGFKARALARRDIAVGNIEVYDGDYTYEGLLKEWKRLKGLLGKDPNAIVGVGWDSITEIYKAVLEDVVGVQQAKDVLKGKEHDNTQLQDYGIMTDQIRSLVRKYRDLDCHFGCTALAKREVDQEDGKTAYLPDVTKGLVSNLYGWFDIVCYTWVDEAGQYWGRFNPAGKYRAKDRMNIMPSVLADPTFERILDYVEEEMTVEDDQIQQAALAVLEKKKTNKKES